MVICLETKVSLFALSASRLDSSYRKRASWDFHKENRCVSARGIQTNSTSFPVNRSLNLQVHNPCALACPCPLSAVINLGIALKIPFNQIPLKYPGDFLFHHAQTRVPLQLCQFPIVRC